MLAIARASLVWVAVVGLPGWILCDGLRRGAGRACNVALAPVAGLGAVYLAAHAAQAMGLEVTPGPVFMLCIGACLCVWVLSHRPSLADLRAWRPRPPALFDGGSMLAAAAVGIALWAIAIRNPAVLPNTDGTHHALFTSRIQALDSVDPVRVTSADGIIPGSYYPLALHIAAALVASVSGVPAGTSLTAGVVLAAALALPAGVFVLARRLDREARTVAGIAAVMAVLFTWFPYSPMVWGGVPTVVGMCLVPAVADGLWPREDGGSRLAVGLCVGIAALGLFQTHNPQLVAAAGTAFVFVLANGGLRCGVRRRTLAVWGVSAATVAASSVSALTATLGLSTSIDSATITGGADRLSGRPSAFFSGGTQLAGWLLSPPIVVLAFLGLAVCRLDKRCRGVGFLFLIWATFVVCVARHVPIITSLAVPWYQDPIRISYYLALPIVIWAAVGLEKLGAGMGWAVRSVVKGRPVRGAAAAGAAVLLSVTAALQAPSAFAMTRDIYRRADLVGSDQLDAFSWLRSHVANGSHVLNTFDDGSGWMGILGYAQPLFATKPEQGGPGLWGDRWHLLTHAGALSHDPLDQRVVRDWHVEYAYIDEHHFPGTPPLAFTARTLEASPAYALVWSRGSVKIFRVLTPQTY